MKKYFYLISIILFLHINIYATTPVKDDLYNALRITENQKLKNLIKNGAKFDAIDGYSAFSIIRLDLNFLSKVKILLKTNIDLNYINKDGNTIIEDYKNKYKKYSALYNLIDSKIPQELQGIDKISPYHKKVLLTKNGKKSILRGIKWQLTSLKKAIILLKNSFEIVRYSYIGDIQKVKKYITKNTIIPNQALLNAGFKNHANIVKLLIKNGANIDTPSKSGKNILYYAVQNNNLELLKYLVKNGGKFTNINNGHSVLFKAVESGYIDIVKYLLPYFKDLDKHYTIKGKFKRVAKTTLLITALQNKHLDIVKLLITNGANINFANNKDETPLLTALRNRYFDMARYLIKKGSDLKAQDIAGNNAFTYAVISKQEDIALKAIKYVDTTQWVDSSIFEGTLEPYEYYIQKIKDEYKFINYIHLSVRFGQTKVIEKLILKGLDINTLPKERDYQFDNLQIAIYYGEVKTVKFLVQNGVNPYKLYNSSLPWGKYNTLLSFTRIAMNKIENRNEIINYLLSLPKASWYNQNENMPKIKKFLNRKIEIVKDSTDFFLKKGIKNNNYSDVIHSTKHNSKLISSVKQMLKLKHNINNETFKNYRYKSTLLLKYFDVIENNINKDVIKKLLNLGASLGNSQQALEEIYMLYSNRSFKYILQDKLFVKDIVNLHKKYDITNVAIKVYKNEHISNQRIELMFELVYIYKLNFDFKRFDNVVKEDDNYMNELIMYYK